MSKYDASGSQVAYEPGSNNRVLKNHLGIVLPEEMNDAELVLLQKLYQQLLRAIAEKRNYGRTS